MKSTHQSLLILASFIAVGACAAMASAVTVPSGATIAFDTDSLTCTINGAPASIAYLDAITGDAVFQFEDLDIQTGATVEVAGSRTMVLESLAAIAIDAIIDVSAPDVNDAPLWMTNDGGAGGSAGGFAGGNWRGNGQGPGGGQYVVNAGSGAGYGGAGGRNGRTESGVGQPYGDDHITFLYGGSGGGGGHEQFYASVGGGGGGGVGLWAATNIMIGPNGGILADGGTVESQPHQLNGGGGSGGSIRLAAGDGTITVDGILSANGGKGGDISIEWGETSSPNSKTGGGGGGGRIAFYSADGTIAGNGTITATGGAPGYYYGYAGSPDGDLQAEAGQDGTITYYSDPYVPPLPAIENLLPADGVLEVSTDTSLTWETSGDFISFDVYFSDDMEAIQNESVTPITVVEPNVPSADLPTLQRGTWYFWKVVGNVTVGGVRIETEVVGFKTETYKIKFDTDRLSYEVEDAESGGGSLVNFYHPPADPNNPDIPVAMFLFDDFSYGSQWEIVATGRYPLWIESAGDIVFAGVASLAGYSPRPLDPRLNPGVAEPNLILGGYPGGYRGDSTYVPPAVGHGPGGGESHRHGGGGGGYGGAGGQGDVDSEQLGYGGDTYGSPELQYLLGGSGGGAADASTGAYGGGALALVAAGNVDIGSTAELVVDGGMGSDDSKGRGRLTGAGGSGGSLLIVAQGTVNIDGLLSANGGAAYSCPAGTDEAGGGGGGRIAIYSADATYTGSATITVDGGKSGKNEVSTSAAEDGQPGTIFVGSEYSFVLVDYISLDDFESYNDQDNLIYDAWLDGWVNGTGSTVGNLVEPFVERKIVHSGAQSMPFSYDNFIAPNYSEAERQWPSPQDWTADGADTLQLWVEGDLSNSAEPLYTGVEDAAGMLHVVVHNDPAVVQQDGWQAWNIAYSAFSDAGVNLSAVSKMYLGVGNRTMPVVGLDGKLYFDDLRLMIPAQADDTAEAN